MAGMKVVVVNCDSFGNVDYEDLKKKAEEYSDTLSALMVTIRQLTEFLKKK